MAAWSFQLYVVPATWGIAIASSRRDIEWRIIEAA
jgi:hypothetical protein